MKKLMFLTAFMLFALCSYSQSILTVTNNSPFTITVVATYELTAGNCFDGSAAIGSILPGNSTTIGSIPNATWTVVRAGILGGPPAVLANSSCGSGCGTPFSSTLSAVWNGTCNGVIIK